MQKQLSFFFPLVLVLAVSAVYGQFLWNPILFDDLPFFMLDAAGHQHVDTYQYSPFELRSLPYATLSWGKAMFGLDMLHFRIENLLLHAAVVVVLFFFLRALFRHVYPQRIQDKLSNDALAFLAAMLFALHPVAVYGAGYLVQRTIVMATLFSLLAMQAWMHGNLNKDSRWLWGGVFFYYLAVSSKEHAIMLPAVLVALSVLRHEDWKQRIAKSWAQLLVLAVIGCWVILAKKGILGSTYEYFAPEMLDANDALNYPLSVLTQCWLFFKYAVLWVLPNPRWMSADMREPFAQAIVSQYLWAALAFVCWGVVAIVLLLRRGRWGLLGFAMFFPWAMFLTELSAVRIQEVFVLYRSYLWAVGSFVLIPLLADLLDRRLALGVLLATTLAMIPATFDRLASFAHPLILWDDALQKVGGDERLPGVYRIYYNRGTSLLDVDDYPAAEADFLKAIELYPDWPYPYLNLGVAYGRMGRWQESADIFTRVIALAERRKLGLSAKPYFGRAVAHENLGQAELAKSDYVISCRVGKMGCDQLEVLSKSR